MPTILLATSLAAMIATGCARPGSGARPGDAGHVDVRDFARCDGITDDREALERAAAAARGRTLWIPSACRLLLSSPGAGRVVATLESGTRIQCEDPSAGFVLGTRICRDGRHPGAACGSDEDCLGGSTGGCVAAVPRGPFAPEREGTYTVFRAAPRASSIGITACSFEIGGVDGYGRCVGGPRDGKPCHQVCAGGTERAGLTCESDAECGAKSPAGACQGREDCASPDRPGTCSGQPGSPAGPGWIDPIDFGGATSTEIARNRIANQRRGHVAINAGTSARVDDNTLTVTVPPKLAARAGVKPIEPTLEIENGIVLEGRGFARGNIVVGSGRLIAALAGFNLVADNHLWGKTPGAVGVLLGGQQNRVEGNQATVYNCIRGDPQGAHNASVIGNRCLGGPGEKIRVTGSGWQIESNYLAWGGAESKAQIMLGEPGLPGAPGQPAQHPVIVGNIVHSDQPDVVLIRFAPASEPHGQVLIVGNSLLAAAERVVGIDASAGEACDRPFIEDLVVQGNLFSGLEVGVRLPTKPEVVRGVVIGANRFARVTHNVQGSLEAGPAP